MSPSIEIKTPEVQPTTQSLWVQAAVAYARFVAEPNLPPFAAWHIDVANGADSAYHAPVSGQLRAFCAGAPENREVVLAALAALADRFGGAVAVGSRLFPSGRVDAHARFLFDGVEFAAWAHVVPVDAEAVAR